MPLSFESMDHGAIAFGFFNIESDMLLLEEWFFFADTFCEGIVRLSERKNSDPFEMNIVAYPIGDPADIGHLMEAIHGIRLTGFIGEVYRKFPFPAEPEGFKQKPHGMKNRSFMKETISSYAKEQTMSVMAFPREDRIRLGEYRFTRPVFHEFIRYVWRGGYPRWKNDVRPDYVAAMKDSVLSSSFPLMEGIAFPD